MKKQMLVFNSTISFYLTKHSFNFVTTAHNFTIFIIAV